MPKKQKQSLLTLSEEQLQPDPTPPLPCPGLPEHAQPGWKTDTVYRPQQSCLHLFGREKFRRAHFPLASAAL